MPTRRCRPSCLRSQRAAELREKRRYRSLAEKHLLLSNTFLQFLAG